jgi:cytochrome P450 family 142 subfamily A polypeptide 1
MPTEAKPVCKYDIVDRNFYLDPFAKYAWLREQSPLSWDADNNIWVASKHEDVSYVSLHPDLFCSGQGIRPTQSVDLSLVGLDGERHVRQRRLINRGFSPRMIRAMEPRIRQVVNEVLDQIADRSTCDFVTDIAMAVPTVVIAELMGLPVERRAELTHWSDRMMAGEGRDNPEDPVLLDAGEAFNEYMMCVAGMIEERRQAHRAGDAEFEDIISVLVGASEEGVLESADELNQDELMMFLAVLLGAGNETTRNAMSGAMWAFSQFPDQWQRLLDHPESFVTMPDEVCRYVSPVISFARTATEDTELRGQRIAEGEKVLMLYQSANRDEDVFESPDDFNVDRDPNPHLAFGIGPHVCIGINLARLEIRVLFEEIARRFPDMRVASGTQPTYIPHALVHSISSLPVEFTPERT